MSNEDVESKATQEPLDFGPAAEFIEENRKANLVRPRKKFAPYTRKERVKRRQEVYRLHFEYGIPAIRIAEIMNVDKNTINNDIQLLYREAGKEWGKIEFEDYVAKQILRLEAQRARLVSYLEKVENIEKKLAIERLITEIDLKLTTTVLKTGQAPEMFWDTLTRRMNKAAKENKLDWRFTTLHEVIKISKKKRNVLDELQKS